MTGDELELVKKGIEEGFKPFANLIERLLGPPFGQLGLTLRDVIGVTVGDRLHFYRAQQQLKFWTKFQAMLKEAEIEPQPVAPKLLLPIVEQATLEDDEDLQGKWAALLANATDPEAKEKVLPSFPEILKQLSSKDAKLLDDIYRYLCKETQRIESLGQAPHSSVAPETIDLGHIETVFFGYARLGFTRLPPGSTFVSISDPTETLKMRADWSEFNTTLDNLCRLGLLMKHFIVRTPSVIRPGEEQQTEAHVFMTGLGFQFIAACTAPKGRQA